MNPLAIKGGAQHPTTAPWARNLDGPRSIEEARAIAKKHGVDIPDDIEFHYAEGGINDAKADAQYFFRAEVTPETKFTWNEFYNQHGKIPVLIRESVLESDEAIVAVFAHEMHELNGLRKEFAAARRGRITAGALRDMINSIEDGGIRGNLHDQAWDVADHFVKRMRGDSK